MDNTTFINNKVISVKDLINFLETLKNVIQEELKNLSTEEEKKAKISEAYFNEDKKSRIIAIHSVMMTIELENKLEGQLELINKLLENCKNV